MKEEKIKRINELYHKSKAEGLTEAEKKEQKILVNLRGMLDGGRRIGYNKNRNRNDEQ